MSRAKKTKSSANQAKSVSTPTSNLQPRSFSPSPQASEVTSNVGTSEPQQDVTAESSQASSLLNHIDIFQPGSTPPPPPKLNQFLQAKLTIGQPNDKYEQEADRIAHQVVTQINTPLQTKSQEEEIQTKSENSLIQRQQIKISPLNRPAISTNIQQVGYSDSGDVASADLENQIQRAKNSGHSLDQRIRQPIEQAIGADFSQVKIHTDTQSDTLNRSLQAKAFTTGNDVFFKKGAYDPNSQSGQELIAHELTHVVQQGSANRVNRSLDTSHQSSCNCPACNQISRSSSNHQTLSFKKEDHINLSPTLSNLIESSHDNRTESPIVQRALSDKMTKEEFINELTSDPGTRTRLHHRPSTGLGRFDAEYIPTNEQLIITVKTYFEFGDKVNKDFKEGAGGWTKEEKAGFIKKFKEQTESIWSEKFTLTCKKVGFEGLKATPIIKFLAVDDYDEAHFNHRVTKNNSVMGTGIGREQNDEEDPQLNIGNFKLSDSRLGPQKSGICRKIAGHDKRRIHNLIEAYKVGDNSTLRFSDNGSSTLDNDAQSRLTDFAKNLVATSRKGSVPIPIIAVGVDNRRERTFNEGDQAQERATSVANFLAPLLSQLPNNTPNPLQTEAFSNTKVDEAKAAYKGETNKYFKGIKKDEYDKLEKLSNHRHAYIKIDEAFTWQGDAYSTLAHEFGHMLGNSDEYFEYGSTAIRDQTAKSLHDTGKPENVLRAGQILQAGTRPVKTTEDTQQASFELAKKAGTDLPQFQSTNSSIMSAGADVLPIHYLPLWEVLGKITTPTIKPEEWTIG